MKKQLLLILFCLAFVSAHAETLVLRTGTRVQGTIVFQNEEVVILKNAEGARFQYPRADVKEIIADDKNGQMPNDSTNVQMVNDQMVNKKASILLELAGGAAFKPGEAAGGGFSADLLVGSHHIKDRHLFIGGGLGYHGLFLGPEKYNFLPIQVALRMPFTESKHAPVFGASLGYGIALSRDYLGGLYAGLDFGYRCQLNPRTALALVAYAQFQQATVTNTLFIKDTSFTQKAGRNLITSGLKLHSTSKMKKAPREHKISILLNESEQRALDRFCDKYGVSNRSRLIREVLMRAILKKIENDQPTLFD